MKHPHTEFDERQFAKMLEALASFRETPLSIGTLSALISTLDFLIAALQVPSSTVIGHLRRSWGILEEVYAVALDEEEKTLSGNDEKLIQEAISELYVLLESERTTNEI
jgi:hypothetical protein